MLRPLPRTKPRQYSDELWDELQRRLSKTAQSILPVKQLKQPATTDERKDAASVFSKAVSKVHSSAPASAIGESQGTTSQPSKHKASKPQSISPPLPASNASDDKKGIINGSRNSSNNLSSPSQPAPPNAQRPLNFASSPATTPDYADTYQTPGKEETHPLTASHSKRAIVEQINMLQSRHDSEITQLREELAAVRVDNSRLQAQIAPGAQAPRAQAHGAADLLIVHTLHERYNRAVSRLESDLPVVSDELLSELRGLVDWHLDMTGRLNRLLRVREGDMAAALPSYH